MNNDFIINNFWNIEVGEAGQETASINKPEFLKFLELNGYGKIYMDGDRLRPTFIRVNNNIARVVARDSIITFGRSYIRERVQEVEKRKKVYDAFMNTIVSKPESMYSMLRVRQVEFMTDLRDAIYFYFRNKIIVVKSEEMDEIDYSDSPGVIWEDQILNFDIEVNTESEYARSSEFNTFLKNISSSDNPSIAWKRYESMLTVTGYLIHEFRDLSKMKAIILMDANLSATPEGGAGKGLFIQAIKQVRQTVIEDGKNFTFNTRFLFQQVKPSTRVLFFDDVTKKFSFEKLFSTITDGIIVERKYGHRFVIPAEKSPRIVASTNYVILGSGGSFERRKYEFEFSNHYNRGHSPYDEFKHNFFADWSRDEWNKFYNLMFYACRRYLALGLVEAPSINGMVKQLIHSTSPEFYDFVQDGISLDTEYNKKSLHETFIRQFPDFNQLKQRTFTAWLTTFAEIKGFRMFERKSGDDYYVTFLQE